MKRDAESDHSGREIARDDGPGEGAQHVDKLNQKADKRHRVGKEQSMWNASIAHELRTPVTILRGRLQGLAEGVFPPQESLFRTLLGQVEGLSRLIEDLRVVSLADSGHLQLHSEWIDLSAEITAFATLLQPELRTEGISLQLSVPDRRAFCDIVRIRQLLLILIENARIHATPSEIHIVAQVLQDSTLRLQVLDNGSGIPQAISSKIFEPFVKNSQPGAGKRAGSGLGLAVVRAIIQASGGTVSITDNDPKGTCVNISLPPPARV